VRRQHDNRQRLINQRIRPVLHLARRITLRMDLRNLLQLQRALQRSREVNPPPQIEKVPRIRKVRNEVLALRRTRFCDTAVKGGLDLLIWK